MAVGLASALTACGMFSPPPLPQLPPLPLKPPLPPPPKLVISIAATAQLNPSANARPSPVVMRLYELKSPAQFMTADFMALFDQDRSTLAADLVTREEFVLQPGEIKTIDKLLDKETVALGVMVAFRNLEKAQWRAMAPLAAGKDNTVAVLLDGIVVRIGQSAK
jgi:type VI secretion system protein VasD